jgi:hypothetical protein
MALPKEGVMKLSRNENSRRLGKFSEMKIHKYAGHELARAERGRPEE